MPIFLIRHAESLSNINIRTACHSAAPLSLHGIEQAQALCAKLPKADQIYVSSYIRTQQTAAPLASRDQITVQVKPIQEFTYLSVTTSHYTTLEERKPYVDAYWQRLEPDYIDGEDAESFHCFYERVARFKEELDDFKHRHPARNLMVFTHGQFILLLQIIATENWPLSPALMKHFRQMTICHPIKNTASFIY